MKKLMISFITLLMLSVSINAQTDAEEVNFMQTIFGMEKQALVESFVNPSEESKTEFWAIYNEYETERKELGKQRLSLLGKYIDTYGNTTDDEVDALVKEMNSIGKSTDKLIIKYYKKLKKLGSVDAAAFLQVEAYIAAKIRVGILEGFPLFGEFK